MDRIKNRFLALSFAALVFANLFCGAPQPDEAETQPLPTSTAVPTPAPPVSTPEGLPGDSELRALVIYANELQPLLVHAGSILERDGKILEATEGGNDEVLCDGQLEKDNEAMTRLLGDIRLLEPPADAAVIHNLLLGSGVSWTEALDNVALFCETGNQLHKIPAVLKFWEAAAKLQDAGNRFWLLILANGVEDWVQR